MNFKIYIKILLLTGLFSVFNSCGKDEVEELVFLNIEISKQPDKTAFQLGETPDFTGIEISEVYTDGAKKPITNFKIDWTADIFKKGTTQATVSARNRTVTFDISFEGDLIETGLPVVYIETENNAPIVSKETYIRANMVIKEKGKILSENPLGIRGRGNATWTYPKKPYKLKLDNKANILDMGEDKDWALLANYCDKTLLRTGIAFKLSRLMDFAWTPKDRFVELVVNGEYMGNYQLVEGIKQGSNRVDIPKTGYLFERDGYYREEPMYFETSRGYGYSFKNPDPDGDLTEAQWSYIRDYMNEFESVLRSETFNDPVSGYRKYINLYSFARWFLYQNILANMDTNVYLTKIDMGDSKLFMGPAWDFEWSIGIGWYEGVRPGPADYYVWNGNAFYYDRLLQDPAFKTEVKNIWTNYQSISQDILNYIDETTKLIDKSQELNFKRWDILNIRVSVGGIPLGSFEKEVECDRRFFINHINWLNTEMAKY
ncbi:MAG: CotH kinase family protein [Tannerella sp.]|jgi:hypothetical protein|nr:CotH kinase family protein [Tannerella sp.]